MSPVTAEKDLSRYAPEGQRARQKGNQAAEGYLQKDFLLEPRSRPIDQTIGGLRSYLGLSFEARDQIKGRFLN